MLPDYSLVDFPLEIEMIINPGSSSWREEKNHQAKKIVDYCFGRDISVAVICDSTTFLGSHWYLDHLKHTGNSLPYLKKGAMNYRGDKNYIAEQSISD